LHAAIFGKANQPVDALSPGLVMDPEDILPTISPMNPTHTLRRRTDLPNGSNPPERFPISERDLVPRGPILFVPGWVNLAAVMSLVHQTDGSPRSGIHRQHVLLMQPLHPGIAADRSKPFAMNVRREI